MSDTCGAQCGNEQRLVQLEKNDGALTGLLSKMDEKMDAMLTKLNRIEVLESHQTHHSEAVGRAHMRIDRLEEDLSECKKFRHKAEGMATVAWAIWAVLGASVFMLFIKILFFMGSNGVTP